MPTVREFAKALLRLILTGCSIFSREIDCWAKKRNYKTGYKTSNTD